MERREFLKLVGVTGAGSLAACDQKVGPQSLIPYLVPPEEVTPGVATWYASTCRECPAGCGVHVKTRDGRVIKLEGNPGSPVNEGRLCARGQLAHHRLYDPDRIAGPRRREGDGFAEIGWDDATAALLEAVRAGQGEPGGVVLLTGLETGTRARLYDEWSAAVGATRVVYEPFAHEALVEANRRTFGAATIPTYDIEGAELVVSFGADYLETWVSPVRYAREWAGMHAVRGEAGERGGRPPGIVVAVEPRLSMTAASADEWIAVRPGTEYLVALGMANLLGAGGEAAHWTPARVAEATGVDPATIERLAALFRDHRSVALPGGVATAHARATAAAVAVNLLNAAGGAIGDTIRPEVPVAGGVEGSYRGVIDLVERMKLGRVAALLVAGPNPAYALPPGSGFVEALENVPHRISFSPWLDETAALATLLLPDHTPLESWGDWVPEAGVASLIQPATRPVFDTRVTPDVLLEIGRALQAAPPGDAAANGGPAATAPTTWRDYLREAWRDRAPTDAAWAELLTTGGVWRAADAGLESAPAAPAPSPAEDDEPTAAGGLDFRPAPLDGPEDGLALVVYPQLALYDGRGANSGWLQELPDPGTTSCWRTWIEVHPETARERGLADGDLVTVASPHGEVEAPVLVYPGVPRGTVAMPLGRGHTTMGRFAEGGGANPVALLPPTAEAWSGGLVYQSVRVVLTATGARLDSLRHQGSDSQHDRGLARAIPAAAALAGAHEEEHHAPGHEPLTVERVARDADSDSPYRWGMAISVDACTGCNACVAACATENNLPYVGPDRVAKSRQMNWIRIERFFEFDGDTEGAPEVRRLPMLCQHCGAAPCEPVCPVYATYHNPDGLNVQVYNRCVGTRYCSNNCPYKVRYFNYYSYEWPEPLNQSLNPDVTLREKGVMEKCTLCVQRIQTAKSAARDEGPDAVVADGAFQTACQQTCPTDAIVFGNLKDPESRVARLSGGELAYSVLEELNTRPANFYLKKVTDRTGAAAPAGAAHGEA